jgi:hypothetical protein
VSTGRFDPGWQLVPYRGGEAVFKTFRVRDDRRIRTVARHLQAHECVALIGPPFAEKSALLQDVAAVLTDTCCYRALYVDLWQASSHDEATFFTSLAALIEKGLEEQGSAGEEEQGSSGALRFRRSIAPQFRSSATSVPTALAFQNYLGLCADAQQEHLVLLIDHLQALPHDLVHGL